LSTGTAIGRRRGWHFWVGLAISLGCIVWAVLVLDWRRIIVTLGRVSPWLTAAGVLAIVVSTFPRVWRWQALFLRTRPPFGPALAAMLVGQVVNYFAPARGGELVRAYWLGERSRVDKAEALGTTVVEKIWDLLIVLSMIGLLPLWMPIPEWLSGPLSGLILFVLVLLIGLFVGVTRQEAVIQLASRYLRFLPERWQVEALAQLGSLLGGFESLRRPGMVGRALFWSLVVWGTGAIPHWLVMRAIGIRISLPMLLFFLAVLRAGVAVPSLPGSVGVYEGIAIVCLTMFGVPTEQATSFGIMMHVVDFIPPILWATMLVWTGRRAGWRRLLAHSRSDVSLE